MGAPEIDRKIFAETLRKWFELNDWPQKVPEDWAKATNSATGPWASQISKAMSCQLDPKTNFFMALGEFNKAVHEQNFNGIGDKGLRKHLTDATPLFRDPKRKNLLVDGAGFFEIYTGTSNPFGVLQYIPKTWIVERVLCDPKGKPDKVIVDVASETYEFARQWFFRRIQEDGADPTLLKLVLAYCPTADPNKTSVLEEHEFNRRDPPTQHLKSTAG